MPSYQIRQSSTAYPLVFLMIDSTDHLSAKTGLSPTVTIRKVGGSFASPSGSVTEIANGWYQVAGNATDSGTLGPLLLHATATGADPSDTLYEVVAHDVQDAVHLGLSCLPNVASGSAGAIPTTGTGSNQISVSSGLVTLAGVTHTGAVIPTTTAVTNAVVLPTGTGAGQISLSSGAVLLQPTQTGVTIPTVTNLTNAPTAGDLTATMKTSVTTAATAATPTAAAVTGAVGSVTAAVTLPSIPANWITAAGINAAALNGKGDWNTTTPPTVAAIATGVWQDTTAGDFTVANSAGKSIYTGVAPGAAGGHFIAGTNAATTVTTAFTSTFTGNLTGSVGSVTGAVGSVTGAVTLPSIPANWITAAGINAAALNGKGDWNTTTPPTAAAIAAVILATPANLLATDSSGRVILQPTQTGVTIPTVTNLTNAVTLPSIPANWITSAGINAAALNGKGDWLLSSSYAAPPSTAAIATAILATPANLLATDSSGRVILQPTQTGVTIPTVTNLTNAATAGDLTATMKASVTTAATAATPTVTAGTVSDKTGYSLNLAQAVPTSNTAQTVGDALNAARADGFGKATIVGTTLTLYAADGTTAVRTFTLDSGSDPTSRT